MSKFCEISIFFCALMTMSCLDMDSRCLRVRNKVHKWILWLNLTTGKCPSFLHIFEISLSYRGTKFLKMRMISKVGLLRPHKCVTNGIMWGNLISSQETENSFEKTWKYFLRKIFLRIFLYQNFDDPRHTNFCHIGLGKKFLKCCHFIRFYYSFAPCGSTEKRMST